MGVDFTKGRGAGMLWLTPHHGFEHEGGEEDFPCCDAAVGGLELLGYALVVG